MYINYLIIKYNEMQIKDYKFDEIDYSVAKEYLFYNEYLKALKSMISNDFKKGKEKKGRKDNNINIIIFL